MSHPTVRFTDSPASRLTKSELDALLRRPLLDRSASSTPTARIQAALCAGLRNDAATPTEIRYSLRRLATPDSQLAFIIASDRAWARHVASARSYLATASGTSDDGLLNARLSVARKLVGHLLTPLPAGGGAGGKKMLSPRAEVSARAALTIVGLQSLNDGNDFDSSIASAGFLALELNLEDKASVRALRNAESVGWLTRLNPTSQGTARWRLRTLTAAEDTTAWEHSETVTALASGRPEEDNLADLINALGTSPAFQYSENVGFQGWLAMVAALSGVPAEQLGLGKAYAKRLRHAVAEAFTGLPGIGMGVPLAPQLDVVAENTLAVFIKADARRDHAELVAKRQQERDAFAARRREERVLEKQIQREYITPSLKALSSYPTAEWPAEGIVQWLNGSPAHGIVGAAAWWQAGPGRVRDEVLATACRKQLAWMLTRNGLSAERARWVVDQLVPEVSAAEPLSKQAFPRTT